MVVPQLEDQVCAAPENQFSASQAAGQPLRHWEWLCIFVIVDSYSKQQSAILNRKIITEMNRSDLVIEMASRFNQLTQRDAEFAVTTILAAMDDALARGHRIEIRGFGSFSVKHLPPPCRAQSAKWGKCRHS